MNSDDGRDGQSGHGSVDCLRCHGQASAWTVSLAPLCEACLSYYGEGRTRLDPSRPDVAEATDADDGEPKGVLRATYCFGARFGIDAEEVLWHKGFRTWDDPFTKDLGWLGEEHAVVLRHEITRARADLAVGRADFAREGLPEREFWRIYPTFRSRCAFLSVHTTRGKATDDVTVIGLLDARGITVLQRGVDLDNFPLLMRDYAFLIAYDARAFAVPALQRAFPMRQPTQPIWDLSDGLAQSSHSAGVRGVEQMMNLRRTAELQRIGGLDAARLWRAHLVGDHDALGILRRYAAEDVTMLVCIAERAYNMFAARLPIAVEPLRLSPRRTCDLMYNPSAIRRLLGR